MKLTRLRRATARRGELGRWMEFMISNPGSS
jgi:hypothetical protein